MNRRRVPQTVFQAATRRLAALLSILTSLSFGRTWASEQYQPPNGRPGAEVQVHPLGTGGETRRTIDLTPSSLLTLPLAQTAAWGVAATIPGGEVVTVAPTGSMRPLFDQHALLILEAAPYDSLRIGDIVTYWDARRKILIVHRLLEKRGDKFWAHGDHNDRMDDLYVTPKNYWKRVCGILYTHQREGEKGK